MGVRAADKMTTSSTVGSLSASVLGRMMEKYDAYSLPGKRERGVRFLALVGLLALLPALGGCGYSLQHRLKEGFQNPQGVYVPVFTNTTDEVGAEKVFTNALIRELQSRGQVTVTSRKPGAYELQGSIDRINYAPAAFTPTPFKGLQDYRRLPTEIVLDVDISLRLVDPATGKELWTQKFAGFRRVPGILDRTYNYEAPSSVGLIQQSLIESQYAGIARDVMRDVYDAMVELF